MKDKWLLLSVSSLIIVSSWLVFSPGNNSIQISNESVSDMWHFIALGDSRQQFGYWDDELQHYSQDNKTNPIRRAIINSIIEDNPNLEFIVHTGDMVCSGGEQDDWDRYFEDIENATKNNVTFYYAVGNHERYTYALGPGFWGPPDENFTTYLTNVELPGNERYYSFNYKDQIHFIIVNTEENWDHGFDITSDQETWIINDLENNSLDFIVAVFHRPCYSVRDSGRVWDANQVRNVLEPIFLQYGVDLVFSGHDHYYYRTIRNGITYITTGGAGAELALNNDLSEWQEGDVFYSEYHYCNVTVTEAEGNLTMTIDTLIFNETTKSTYLVDSCMVRPSTTITTTTEPTTTTTEVLTTTTGIPTITTKEPPTTTIDIPTTTTTEIETSTSLNAIPNPLILLILGLIVIIICKKGSKG
ncbi:MAG: metallophosphoesterase [Candidatus Heimdallarchaeota archaeon]|nr:MAG: metallophosphoesterase [Candidatus Heimdallarchaeota archaeon]